MAIVGNMPSYYHHARIAIPPFGHVIPYSPRNLHENQERTGEDTTLLYGQSSKIYIDI